MCLPANIVLAVMYPLATYADLSKTVIRAKDGGLHLVDPFWELSISSEKAAATNGSSVVAASIASLSRSGRRHEVRRQDLC